MLSKHAPNNTADNDLKMQAPGKKVALHMGIPTRQENLIFRKKENLSN